MQTYGFSFKNSTETLWTSKKSSEEEAVEYFAKLKGLTIDQFISLFKVFQL